MKRKILVLGYGNPAREDDGLGQAIAGMLEKLFSPDISVEIDYQLKIEDAAAVAVHDIVIFIDASSTGRAPFSFSRIIPIKNMGLTTHSMLPDRLLGLTESVYRISPEAYLMAVRGYSFTMFKEELSPKASANLKESLAFLKQFILKNLN